MHSKPTPAILNVIRSVQHLFDPGPKRVAPSAHLRNRHATSGLAGLLVACLLSPQTPVRGGVIVTTIPAVVAGNVVDANGDGHGDTHDSLPGSGPLLMSAGLGRFGAPAPRGTARMQIEWNLASVPDAMVSQATVMLWTHSGPNDHLPTYLYHALTDQDGRLTTGDFEAPTHLLGGLVMPVTNGERPYSFDITGLLRADLAMGRSYFSLQGRVDERLSGRYLNGVEVYTTALSTPPSRLPRLIVRTVPEPGGLSLILAMVGGLALRTRQSARD